MILFAALVAVVVATTTATAVAQPAVAAQFDAGPADVGWIVFGYSATFAVSTVAFAQFGARWGTSRCLASGIALLSAGSLMAVLAPSLLALIVARVIAGVGAGAIPTLTITAVAHRYRGAELTRAIAVNAAGVGVGNVAGPLIGGLLLELAGWRAAVGLGLVAAPLAVAVGRMSLGDPDRSAPIDRVGLAGIAGVAAGLVLVFNRAPLAGLAPIVAIGAFLAIGGGLVLRRWVASGRSTMLPAALVGDPVLRASAAHGALVMTGILGALVILPTAMARAHGLDGIGLGLVLVPMAVAAALVSVNAARLVPAGAPSATLLAATIAATALIADALLGATAPPILHALTFGVLGAGFGLLQAPIVARLSARFAGHRRGLAIGLFNVTFFLGGAAGAALGTAILGRGLESALLADTVVPGFRTAMLALAVGPLIVAASIVRRVGADRVSAAVG